MNNKKRIYAKRHAARHRPQGRGGKPASAPYLNNARVRGLLSPGPTAARNTGNQSFLPFLDQLGGLDGIIATMGKVQKMFQMFQQLGPMLNMINSFGSMFGGKASTASIPSKPRPLSAKVRAAARKTATRRMTDVPFKHGRSKVTK